MIIRKTKASMRVWDHTAGDISPTIQYEWFIVFNGEEDELTVMEPDPIREEPNIVWRGPVSNLGAAQERVNSLLRDALSRCVYRYMTFTTE